MPLYQVYVCPNCGAESGRVTALPTTWFSVNLPVIYATAGTMNMEYFDTWNCLSVYAGEQNIAATEPVNVEPA